MIFETHAHYDDERFDEDRDILIEKLFQKNICNIINVGASIESTKTTIALAKKYENMYAAVGVHPSDKKPLHGLKSRQKIQRSLQSERSDSIITGIRKKKCRRHSVTGLHSRWD